MRLQATAGGVLGDILQRALDKTPSAGDMRTKCIEDGGISIKRTLVRSDPSGRNRCQREWCTICLIEQKSGEKLERIKVSCFTTNIGYGFECRRAPCWDGEKSTSCYEGESSRSGAIRFGQHMDLYRRVSESAKNTSWMWEHTQEKHGGIRGPSSGLLDYNPFIHGSFQEVLNRLLEEGVRIKDRVDDIRCLCLNSKNQYFRPQYTRLNFRALLD